MCGAVSIVKSELDVFAVASIATQRRPGQCRLEGVQILGYPHRPDTVPGPFGADLGEKKSSAQITRYYTPETLIGRQVAAVVNFPPRQIGKFLSDVLVLGFPDEDGEVVLVGPSRRVPDGGRLY